jgi:hypothetical protein
MVPLPRRRSRHPNRLQPLPLRHRRSSRRLPPLAIQPPRRNPRSKRTKKIPHQNIPITPTRHLVPPRSSAALRPSANAPTATKQHYPTPPSPKIRRPPSYLSYDPLRRFRIHRTKNPPQPLRHRSNSTPSQRLRPQTPH